MNRIVREHYPAAKLPEDLQRGSRRTADVMVTIVIDTRTPAHRAPFAAAQRC